MRVIRSVMPAIVRSTDMATTEKTTSFESVDLKQYLPQPGLPSLSNPQTALPSIAKDPKSLRLIEDAVRSVPTHHSLLLRDARRKWGLA